MKKVLSLLAIFTLVVSIFSTIPVNNVQSKELKDYSGEELFEGVIFGYGEVAKLFPEMWEESLLKDFTYTDEQVQKIKEIESELKQVDPDFFTKFKEGIQSGDHVVIEETIQKTEESLMKVFEDEVKQASSDKKMRAMATKPGFVIALAYSYVGATHSMVKVNGRFKIKYLSHLLFFAYMFWHKSKQIVREKPYKLAVI